MTDREALNLALEALEAGDWYIGQLELLVYASDDDGTHENRAKVQTTITAIKEALAQPVQPVQPVQEPVAWCWIGRKGWTEYGPIPHDTYPSKPLYAAPLPVQRPWVGLTDEEVTEVAQHFTESEGFRHGVDWAEAKLKEKNT